MMGAGTAAYLTGKKDRSDFHKNNEETDRLVKDRSLILAAMNGIADTQSLLAKGPDR